MRTLKLLLQDQRWKNAGPLWIRTGIVDHSAQFSPTANGSQIARWRGHFALINQRENQVELIVDRPRSFPLFYAQTDQVLFVSDNFEALRAELGITTFNEDAHKEFASCAFVTAPDTLFTQIFQAHSGATTTISLIDAKVSVDYWGRLKHLPPASQITDEKEFAHRFTACLDEAFTAFLAASKDRQLLVPLSGGLDSRLVLAQLVKHGARERVLAFTYGNGNTPEAAISRRIAKLAGCAWTCVDYDPKLVEKAWKSPAAAAWMRSCYTGTGLPHIQDWFALDMLVRSGKAHPDAIVLPGHTLVGNFHNEEYLDRVQMPERDEVAQILLGYHNRLLPTPVGAAGAAVALKKIYSYLDVCSYTPTPESLRDVIEGYNLATRQSVYINASVRSYEFFGLAWEMPMFDAPLFDLFDAASAELTATRTWYGHYVARCFAEATGHTIPYFESHTVTTSQQARNRITKILRATGLMRLATRVIQTWGFFHHPMSFNVFVTESPCTKLLNTWRLRPYLGRFASLFLADSWGAPHGLFGEKH